MRPRRWLLYWQNILNYDNLETEAFLIRDGMVMFFLHVIFEKGPHNQDAHGDRQAAQDQNRGGGPGRGRLHAHPVLHDAGLCEGRTHLGRTTWSKTSSTTWTQSTTRNTFVMWSKQLKDQQHSIIKEECERVAKLLNECHTDFTENNFNCHVVSGAFEK